MLFMPLKALVSAFGQTGIAKVGATTCALRIELQLVAVSLVLISDFTPGEAGCGPEKAC